MRNVRKSNRKKKKQTKRQLLKFAGAVVLVVIAVGLLCSTCEKHVEVQESQKMQGVWVSYVDFKKLGLYNKTENEFRANAEAFYERAESFSLNTVFFHVRAFKDATYNSDYFPMSKYIWDRKEEISYDPLEIMIELAHEHDMQLHAWMNPYRQRTLEQAILDPAKQSSTDNILLCIDEVLENYQVDGIHFDDYFYKEGSNVSTSEKMNHVNNMIRTVYKEVKKLNPDAVFGISPAGNVGYCESIGADVKTWMSEDGYVDYVIPQIYWTDEHSATWREKMFSDTLDEWCEMRENDADLYVGLALYRTGTSAADDPGWERSDHNIEFQINQIQQKKCDGFVFFSASDLFRKRAESELSHSLPLLE